MRRVALIAVILALAVSGVAEAAGHSAKVSGQFTLTRGWFEQPDVLYTHTVTLTAQTNPARGSYTFSSSDGRWFSGTVTCIVVDGKDAWLAGPATAGSEPGMEMFFWLRDGGRSSLDRVVAVVEGLGTGVTECQAMDTGYPLFPLDSGSVKVIGG